MHKKRKFSADAKINPKLRICNQTMSGVKKPLSLSLKRILPNGSQNKFCSRTAGFGEGGWCRLPPYGLKLIHFMRICLKRFLILECGARGTRSVLSTSGFCENCFTDLQTSISYSISLNLSSDEGRKEKILD